MDDLLVDISAADREKYKEVKEEAWRETVGIVAELAQLAYVAKAGGQSKAKYMLYICNLAEAGWEASGEPTAEHKEQIMTIFSKQRALDALEKAQGDA